LPEDGRLAEQRQRRIAAAVQLQTNLKRYLIHRHRQLAI
jgi:hypothetical protein